MDELEALKRCWEDIKCRVSDDNVRALNSFLYAKEIYGYEVRDMIDAKRTAFEGSDEMLKALKKKIKRDPEAFDTFLQALRADSANDSLADRLSRERDGLARG